MTSSTLRYCCVGPAPFDDIGDIPYHDSASSSRKDTRIRHTCKSSSPEVPVLPAWARHSAMTDTMIDGKVSEENRKRSSAVHTVSQSSHSMPSLTTTSSKPETRFLVDHWDNFNGNAKRADTQLSHSHGHANVNRKQREEKPKANTSSNHNEFIGNSNQADGNLNNNVSNKEYGNGFNHSRDNTRDDSCNLIILRNDTRVDLRSGVFLTHEEIEKTVRSRVGTKGTKNRDINMRNLLVRHIVTDSDIHASCYPSRRSNLHDSNFMSKVAGCVHLKYPDSPVEFYPLQTLTPSPPLGPPRPAWEDS